MGDSVWALHDFSPENEDELAFRAGDEITVVEKDDLYGDGWWQGRVGDGAIGLFPVAYTSPHPPTPGEAVPEIRLPGSSTLDPLPEESEHEGSGDNAVMAATMTDIQHAIDQLAVNRAGDNVSRRTFSFISGSESERDTEHGMEREVDSPDGWRGASRRLLAENAGKANQATAHSSSERLAPPIPVELSDESEGEDEDDRHNHRTSTATSVPPTAKASDFPIHKAQSPDPDMFSPTTLQHFNHLSINSPTEGLSPAKPASELDPYGATRTPTPLRSPVILPEQDGLRPPNGGNVHALGSEISLPSVITPSPPGAFLEKPKLYSDADSTHGDGEHFFASPLEMDHPEETKKEAIAAAPPAAKIPTPKLPSPPPPEPTQPPPQQVPSRTQTPNIRAPTPKSIRAPTPKSKASSPGAVPSPSRAYFDEALKQPLPSSNPMTPSAAATSQGSVQVIQHRTTTPLQPTPLSSSFSMPQSAATTASFHIPAYLAQSQSMSQPASNRGSLGVQSMARTNAAEWGVEQVTDWLRAKNFDDSIVNKFIEHEITGDVLLDLDVNMLKELEIPAFGKRMRIANAISELRRSGGLNSETGSPNFRQSGDQSFNASSSMGSMGSVGSPSAPNISSLSDTFHAGPLSNGNMQMYLQQQQLQQPLPTMGHSQVGLGLPSMFYGSQPNGAHIHERQASLASTAPSNFTDSAADPGNGLVTVGPPRASSNESWTHLQSAPPHQQVHQVNGNDAASTHGGPERTRSESDPGSLIGSTPAASGPASVSTDGGDGEGWSMIRKGSLRTKPSMATQDPNGRWAMGQNGNTSGSIKGLPANIPEEKEEVEVKPVKPVTLEVDTLDVDRGSVSESDVTPGPMSGLGKRMSTRKAVRASASSQVTAASESKSDTLETTPVSSIPPSPSLKTSVFGGTVGSRRKQSAEDGSAPLSARNSKSGERLSFFGGTLGKSRKPPPAPPSDTSEASPTVSSQPEKSRGLSRLYLSGSTRKSQTRPSPPAFVGSTPGTGPTPASPPQRQQTATLPRPTSPESPRLRKRPMSSPTTALSAALPGINGAPQAAMSALSEDSRHRPPPSDVELKPGMTALDQIGPADHSGWMRKRGDRYNAWKLRYFALKGPHLYYVKTLSETKIKGYINIVGYKVVADENVYPGRYGFRIVHETEKTHYFSSVEQQVVREWMKALMKATIGRDYNRPVVSSCNIPTIPLMVAQAMNPAPRPPSPTARDATQKAMRRDNVNQLSSRDALVLMGMAGEPDSTDKARLDSFFKDHAEVNGVSPQPTPYGGQQQQLLQEQQFGAPMTASAPARPSREMRKPSPNMQLKGPVEGGENSAGDMELISWINGNLPPEAPSATDLGQSLSSGLTLYRLAESIKGLPTDVPDSAFPLNGEPEKLEGLFKLFDFLLDNDVRMGSVSINDVRLGNKEKITQLVKSLKSWQERRENMSKGMQRQPVSAGPWMAVG